MVLIRLRQTGNRQAGRTQCRPEPTGWAYKRILCWSLCSDSDIRNPRRSLSVCVERWCSGRLTVGDG